MGGGHSRPTVPGPLGGVVEKVSHEAVRGIKKKLKKKHHHHKRRRQTVPGLNTTQHMEGVPIYKGPGRHEGIQAAFRQGDVVQRVVDTGDGPETMEEASHYTPAHHFRERGTPTPVKYPADVTPRRTLMMHGTDGDGVHIRGITGTHHPNVFQYTGGFHRNEYAAAAEGPYLLRHPQD